MVSKTEDIGKKEVRKVLNVNHDDSASSNHRGRGRTRPEKRKDLTLRPDLDMGEYAFKHGVAAIADFCGVSGCQ